MPTKDAARPVRVLVIEDHLGWSRGVARGVSRAYRFVRGSQEESDLEQTAYLALIRCGMAFDAERVPAGGDTAGAFRGYAHRELQSECRREARRLRNAGTYRTRREQDRPPIIAEPTSDLSTLHGDYFDLPDRDQSFLIEHAEREELNEIAREVDEEFLRDWMNEYR